MTPTSLVEPAGSRIRIVLVLGVLFGLSLAHPGAHRAHAQDGSAHLARPLFTIDAPAPGPDVVLDARALIVGTGGSVYIADVGHGRVQRFDRDGTFLGTWGETGQALGRFATSSYSWGLAAGPDGAIWTSEQRPGPTGPCNHRLQHFDAAGVFQDHRWAREAIAAVGPDGSTYGRACVAWPNRDVRLVRRAPDGTVLHTWGTRGSGPGEFGGILSVDVAKDGTVWVADRDNHRVQAFDAAGRFLRAWGQRGDGAGEFEYPGPIAVHEDRVYVASAGRIHRFQADGTFVGTLRHAGAMANNPVTTMDVGPDGGLFVLSEPRGRIERYGTDGVLATTWGELRASSAPLTSITRIMASPAGGLYVFERNAFRIQRLDSLGAPIGAIDLSFLDRNTFDHPIADAAPSADGGAWLLLRTGDVMRLDASGAIEDRWPAVQEELLGYGGALAVAEGGALYVSAFEAPWIHRFEPDGTPLDGFGDDPNPSDGRFPSETWLFPSVAPDGSVFVTDHHPSFGDALSSLTFTDASQEVPTHRIRRFSPEGDLLDSWVLEDLVAATADAELGYELHGRAAVDAQGAFVLSVSVPGSDPHVAMFSAGGEPRGRLWPGTPRSSSIRLRGPAIDASGRIFVAESHQGDAPDRIHAFGAPSNLGWRVALFDNPHAIGWPVTITEHAALDFDWGSSAPSPLPQGQPFAVRSERLLDSDGEILMLNWQARGGSRVWLDDLAFSDQWTSDAVAGLRVLVLPRGPHRLRVDSAHHGDRATLRMALARQGGVQVLHLPALGASRP